MATTVCISAGRCSSQLQCQKLKMDYSSGSMVVAGMKMAGRLPIHIGTCSMVSTKYRKMKISMNLGNLDIRIQQANQEKCLENARHSSTTQDMHVCQPKQEHARHYSTSEEIISQINKETSQLSELVGALKADDEVNFFSVLTSICKEHNKLPAEAIIQGIRIPGDTLIHTAARYKAERMLILICKACPPLLTVQNLVGDTVWHVVATEGLVPLFKQLSEFRKVQLSKAGKNAQHLRLNSLNNEGNTALHASLISCNEIIAYVLFDMTPAHERQRYFWPNKKGKCAICLAAEAGYVNLFWRMMNVAALHPGSLSETHKGKSIIHAAGKHSVPKKVAADRFASLSTARTTETTSVGVSPQYPVPLPQSQFGSPLFWVGVGVGLSALSSWGTAKLKASGILIQDTTE